MADLIQILIAAAPADRPPEAPMKQLIMLFVIIGLLFYFLIIRPQKREQAQKQRMIASLEKGDRVVTIGGIHGTVAGIDQNRNTVTIDVGKNVKIEFSRNAISSVEKKGKKQAQSGTKDA